MKFPSAVKTVIVSSVDSNLVSLVAVEYLIASLQGELYEELYDSHLLPIAAAEPTYAVYIFKSAPDLALILRRSQIRFGHRKKYFKELLSHPVKFIGIGSLPIYLKPEDVLAKGKDIGLLDRFGFTSFVVYCENGNIQESARHLSLQFLQYIASIGIEKNVVENGIQRLLKLKELSAK